MFDVVTSLGYNCEISFRLENYLGQIDSMLFSWSYELEREKFPEAIRRPEQIFAGGIRLMEDNMILCENMGIKYHPRYDILLKDGKVSEEAYLEALAELKSRVEHLKGKFTDLLAGEKRILFFMKVENLGEKENCSFVSQVFMALKEKCVSGRFELIVIVEQNALKEELKQLECEQLKVRTLKCFAPRKHTDIMGDVSGWLKILREFLPEKDDGMYYKRLWKRRIYWFQARLKKMMGK